MSLVPIPAGEVGAVVTYLEMRAPPAAKPGIPPRLEFERLHDPTPGAYREMFRAVGARWLWFSRLVMADRELGALLCDPRIEIYRVLDRDGRLAGMIELDLRTDRRCELAFVGLLPELAGKGLGRDLLAGTLIRAWRDGIDLVTVHTCTLDHPAALPTYLRSGFTAVGRAFESFPDPRLIGALPTDCAPQVPLLGTDGSTQCPADS